MSFIDLLKPIVYRMDDRNRYEGQKDGSKADLHDSVGLSAQNVKAAAEANGLDPQMFGDFSNPEKFGVKYEAIIPFLILEIQALKAKP